MDTFQINISKLSLCVLTMFFLMMKAPDPAGALPLDLQFLPVDGDSGNIQLLGTFQDEAGNIQPIDLITPAQFGPIDPDLDVRINNPNDQPLDIRMEVPGADTTIVASVPANSSDTLTIHASYLQTKATLDNGVEVTVTVKSPEPSTLLLLGLGLAGLIGLRKRGLSRA